jgi:Leucine-rich repeat (LRR) protein
VQLETNNLTGPLPPSLYSRPLQQLLVANNRLTGELSQPLPSTLLILDLSNNQFTGTLDVFSELTSATYITINDNQLSGPIPPALGFNLTQLRGIDISNNRLTGTFSRSCTVRFRLTCVG